MKSVHVVIGGCKFSSGVVSDKKAEDAVKELRAKGLPFYVVQARTTEEKKK